MKTIEIGTEVNGKLGKGTITRIITKSTGYVEVRYSNGTLKKEMAFNLYDNEGNSLKNNRPTKVMEKPNIMEDNIRCWANIAMSVNEQLNQNPTWKLAESKYGSMNTNGNKYIENLKSIMFTQNHLTYSQAYQLARYGVESGQLK